MRTIVIIGGGFCGSVLAVNLLRRCPPSPLRLVLIEKQARLGTGVAYRSSEHPFLLNVPAGRMSASSADPDQFIRFAQRRDESLIADDFLPRQLYGEYLEHLLQSAARSCRKSVLFEHVHAEAEDVQSNAFGGRLRVTTFGGRHFDADDVVLACGDPPPRSPSFVHSLEGHPAYARDAYGPGAVRGDVGSVLLIGTGLTMADAALATARVAPNARIHAISRHGWLPALQQSSVASVATSLRMASAQPVMGVRPLVAAFRALVRDVEQRGGDWRDAINAARGELPGLWKQLPHGERARFLRHLRSRWDRHRHRLPLASAARLTAMQRRGQLQIHAGHIYSASEESGQLRIRWRDHAGGGDCGLLVDRVINCTGADQRLTETADPLLRRLLIKGYLTPDSLGLGLRTGSQGTVITDSGATAEHLFYVGPMLRAELWEATAVAELRGHVERLADRLLPATARAESRPEPRAFGLTVPTAAASPA